MMDDTSYKLIHLAKNVRKGKLESVRKILSSSGLPSLQSWSKEGYVLLREAIKYKRKDIAKLLLDYGANVNSKGRKNSNTPLHFAVLYGDIEMVQLLLDRGANINAKGRKYNSILDYKMEQGEGYTPLHLAVRAHLEEIIKLLLSRGANVNIKGKGGITCLHIAAAITFRNAGETVLQTVQHLLNYGACVDSIYTSSSLYWLGNTPLHFAVQLGCRETVELILSRGANVNARAHSALTALDIAITNGHTELVEVLLKSGAEINCTINIPLHRAVIGDHLEIVDVLLNFGADVNYEDAYGRTALHIAIEEGHKKLVEVLLKCGTKIDLMNTPPLHVAVTNGRTEIIEVLLKFGVDIDTTDKNGKTALYIAIERGYKNLVELLLKCGAKIDSMNTPLLHVAVTNGRKEIIDVLLKFGADIESKDENGRTALHIAVANSPEQIVEVVLNFGADIDSKDEDGRTGLHYAYKRGNEYVTQTLLEHGCNINVTCKNQTPVDVALTNNNWNFLRILKRHIIKMKTANLYVNVKYSLLINSGDEINYKGFQNECENEIASMKNEKVNNGNVSFYDILTEKDVKQLAVYVKNDSIAHVLRSNDYKRKFPLYARILNSKFRKGERRREFLEQNVIHINKFFYLFHMNFGLPQECTEEIFNHLSCTDLRILFSAY